MMSELWSYGGRTATYALGKNLPGPKRETTKHQKIDAHFSILHRPVTHDGWILENSWQYLRREKVPSNANCILRPLGTCIGKKVEPISGFNTGFQKRTDGDFVSAWHWSWERQWPCVSRPKREKVLVLIKIAQHIFFKIKQLTLLMNMLSLETRFHLFVDIPNIVKQAFVYQPQDLTLPSRIRTVQGVIKEDKPVVRTHLSQAEEVKTGKMTSGDDNCVLVFSPPKISMKSGRFVCQL